MVMTDDLALFDTAPFLLALPEPGPVLSADRRRTIRQAALIHGGYHPLSPVVGYLRLKLHPQAASGDDRSAPGRRCGNCWYRDLLYTNGNRKWPKCTFGRLNATDTSPEAWPRVSRGAATDCRAWWPGCTDHSYGDPGLSPDAARHVPETEPNDRPNLQRT